MAHHGLPEEAAAAGDQHPPSGPAVGPGGDRTEWPTRRRRARRRSMAAGPTGEPPESAAMSDRLRVAITLEQCWHRVPGGTATSILELTRALAARPDLEMVGVSARHRHPPVDP